MGIAGMILGILAVVFAIIPIFGWIIAIPCLLLGLPLSIIGLIQNRRRGHGYGMAIAGIIYQLFGRGCDNSLDFPIRSLSRSPR